MKRREMLEYGFTSFNGKTWHNDQVDRYNATQSLINARMDCGIDVHDLADDSHRMFCIYSDLSILG